MIKASIEYIGFRTTPDRREYVLRSRSGSDMYEYTVGIAHAAFATGRARFQDGPEISYLRLLHELEAAENPLAQGDFTITDAELSAYREAHTPQPRRQSFSRPVRRDVPAGSAEAAAGPRSAHD